MAHPGGVRAAELSQRRLERWRVRVADGEGLDDAAPGGSAVHGLTPDEQDEIVAVFDEWGDIDSSHRKLAHRGSWLGRFWADPSTVRRVLEGRDLRFRGPKRHARSVPRPPPVWVEQAPNRIWVYDTTHWTRAGAATTVICDVISRKPIADITSADETSIDVLRAELEIQRERYNTIRPHARIGYVTPDQEHRGHRHTIRAARRDGLARARRQRIAYHRNQPSRGPEHAG